LNASWIAPWELALVRIPVFALTQISLMPGGARNGISGLPARAIFMKSRKIGAV
jgi:hypothetical protein